MVEECTKELSEFTRKEHQRRLSCWKAQMDCEDIIEMIYDEKVSYSLGVLMNLMRAGITSCSKLEAYLENENTPEMKKAKLMKIRGMGTLKSNYVLERMAEYKK